LKTGCDKTKYRIYLLARAATKVKKKALSICRMLTNSYAQQNSSTNNTISKLYLVCSNAKLSFWLWD